MMDILPVESVFILLIFSTGQTITQAASQPANFSTAVVKCYTDPALSDMSTRGDMSMLNLIGLIRKFELSAKGSTDMATTAAMFLRRFRVDGMTYNPHANISMGDLPFYPTGNNAVLQKMIENTFLPVNEAFPGGVFTDAEECALHWMLSFNLNSSVKTSDCASTVYPTAPTTAIPTWPVDWNITEDDHNYRYTRYYSCLHVSGVVYTPWYVLAPGNVLAALAASANPKNYYQDVDNVWVASLAGDLALKAVVDDQQTFENYDGFWNGLGVMHRDYYFILANIQLAKEMALGDIDGLVLALKTREWRKGKECMSLSQVLEMYYTEMGLYSDPQIRACNIKGYSDLITDSDMENQTFNFAIPLMKKFHIEKDNATAVSDIKEIISNLTDAMHYMFSESLCKHNRLPRTVNPVYNPSVDLYIVIDFSVSWFFEQKAILASMTMNMDVSPWTSRIAVVANNNNSYIIPWNYSFNGAEIAERIYDLNYEKSKSASLLCTLEFLYDEVHAEEMRMVALNGANTRAILIMATGDIYPPEDKDSIVRVIQKFRQNFPDTQIFIYTHNPNYYTDFVSWTHLLNYNYDDPSAYPTHGYYIAMGIMAQIPRRLMYNICNESHDDEDKLKFTDNVSPGYVKLYSYSPIYFHGAKRITISFQGLGNNLLVCTSRNDPLAFEDADKCAEITKTRDIFRFEFIDPCYIYLDLTYCRPIYFSVQALSEGKCIIPTEKSLKLGCRFPIQSTFEISHKGMSCKDKINNTTNFPTRFPTTEGITHSVPLLANTISPNSSLQLILCFFACFFWLG